MEFLPRLRNRAAHATLTLKAAAVALLVSPGVVQAPIASAAVAAPMDPMAAYLELNPAEKKQAIECLGEAVYFEAGFEPREGQMAVAQVILNRVRDPYYPDTVCGVVYQGWERRTGCQFSFVCDGSLKRRPPTARQEIEAEAVAKKALKGQRMWQVRGATHYHTDYVDPYWAPGLDKVATVGTHIFYENPYSGPDYAHFRYHGGEVADRAKVKVRTA